MTMRVERDEETGLCVVYDAQTGAVLHHPHEPERLAGASADGSGDAPQPPPLRGRGSGLDAWRDYAAGQGLSVGDDVTRDELVAQLRATGAIPTGDEPGDDDDEPGGGRR